MWAGGNAECSMINGRRTVKLLRSALDETAKGEHWSTRPRAKAASDRAPVAFPSVPHRSTDHSRLHTWVLFILFLIFVQWIYEKLSALRLHSSLIIP